MDATVFPSTKSLALNLYRCFIMGCKTNAISMLQRYTCIYFVIMCLHVHVFSCWQNIFITPKTFNLISFKHCKDFINVKLFEMSQNASCFFWPHFLGYYRRGTEGQSGSERGGERGGQCYAGRVIRQHCQTHDSLWWSQPIYLHRSHSCRQKLHVRCCITQCFCLKTDNLFSCPCKLWWSDHALVYHQYIWQYLIYGITNSLIDYSMCNIKDVMLKVFIGNIWIDIKCCSGSQVNVNISQFWEYSQRFQIY